MSNISINQNPYDYFGSYGPPTIYSPEWTGQGYKHYVFDDSPVAHVRCPDGQMHQFLNIHPHEAHLPVESELMEYVDQTGYNPAEMTMPDYEGGWIPRSQQFGFPDSIPHGLSPMAGIRAWLPDPNRL